MLGFKRFFNARRVVAGVELVQKIVKGQFDVPASFGTDPFCISDQFQVGPHTFPKRFFKTVSTTEIVSGILRRFQRFWTPMLRAWFFQLINTPNNSPDCRGER